MGKTISTNVERMDNNHHGSAKRFKFLHPVLEDALQIVDQNLFQGFPNLCEQFFL
jgi:hypothetical protein